MVRILQLKPGFVYGRRDGDRSVSRKHFVIDRCTEGWSLSDCSSNGTFIYGRRIHQHILQDLDVIQAGNSFLLYREGALIILKRDRYLENREPETCHPWRYPVPPPEPLQKIRIQKPEMTLDSAQGQSMGTSAFMILSSSAASVLSMAINGQAAPASFAASAVSAGVMAASFLAFGQISRQKSRRFLKRQAQEAQQSYQNYLNSIRKRMQESLQAQSEKTNEQVQKILAADEADRCSRALQTPVPFGWQQMPLFELEMEAAGYREEKSPGFQAYLDAAAWPRSAPSLRFLKYGVRNHIPFLEPAALEKLYTWLAWTARDVREKIAFIGSELKPRLLLPCSYAQEKRLVFNNAEDFNACTQGLDASGWIVFSQEDVEKIPADQLWIFTGSCSYPDEVFHASLFSGSPVRMEDFKKSSRVLKPESSLQPSFTVSSLKEARRQKGFRAHLASAWIDLDTDGPHFLIAGATGSGKSELLLSIVLELAYSHPPDELQIVTIDYKGKAFSSPLERLPHFAGGLSNLEPKGLERLKKALSRELQRRQNLMAKWQQDHPDAVPDLDHFNQAHPQAPLSRLLILVDEFGQLKAQSEQSLEFLIETARIGRSLGIHLFLSTQKPAGLVSEQIWANCRTHICGRVNSRQDSMEMLGHDKALHLQHPGSCIIQVQSAREQQGQGFYLKQKRTPEVIDYSAAMQKTPAWQEWILHEIEAQPDKRRWILVPDPAENTPENAVCLDAYDHTDPKDLADFKSVLCLCRAENLGSWAIRLSRCSKHPVFCLEHDIAGIPSLNNAQLWMLLQIGRPFVILLERQKLPEWAKEAVLKTADCSVVRLCPHLDYSMTSEIESAEWKFLLDPASREQSSMLFAAAPAWRVQKNSICAMHKGKQIHAAIAQMNQNTQLTEWEKVDFLHLQQELEQRGIFGFRKVSGRALKIEDCLCLITEKTDANMQKQLERLEKKLNGTDCFAFPADSLSPAFLKQHRQVLCLDDSILKAAWKFGWDTNGIQSPCMAEENGLEPVVLFDDSPDTV